MKLHNILFYSKKLLRDFFNPLIYNISTDTGSDLNEYYFLFDEEQLLTGGSQDFHFDEAGIPIIPTYIDIEKSSFHYYPISIGQYALAIYHSYLQSFSSHDKHRFLMIADWFVENQTEMGYWNAEVPEKKYNLDEGWPSAMAQGRVISVLLRAKQLTDDIKYEESAQKALTTFDPKKSKFVNFIENHVFYEEYPTSPGSFVLNGMIFALFGLYDYYRYEKNQLAHHYFNHGIETLEHIIDNYDMGFWSFYDLRHLSWDQSKQNPATVHYHYIHINQLKILFALTGIERFQNFALKWEKDARYFKNKMLMYRRKFLAISKR
jgi:hypothetical protein